MSKEVAVKEAGTLVPTDVLAEMEAAAATERAIFDLNTDVRLPQLRLVQATTQNVDDARPGQIIDTFTNEALDSIDVIVVNTFKTRALFDGGKIGDPPRCTSSDAIIGVGDPGGDCTRCPHANWRSGGRCQLRYNYLAVVLGDDRDPENELPRGVMMHGTSAKVASRLNTMLLGAKFPWSNVITLSSGTETNDRGVYKVWDVKRARAATTEELITSFQWHKQVKAAKSVSIEGDDNRTPGASTPVEEDIPF
jgi:hypothetical protein